VAWIEGWTRAWPARDADAVAVLYAEHATFVSHPFRELQSPREYAAWAFADQADVRFRFGEPIVDGDRAAVEWWAVVTTTTGDAETLAGVSLLRFDDAGLVVEQRDVWASEPGAVSLPRWAPS
jgi:ketosteroid isomerase-like protein